MFIKYRTCVYVCNFCVRYAKEVCDAIVAKCLTGRPKTVEKSQTAFMLWVELEAIEQFLVFFFFDSALLINLLVILMVLLENTK